MSLICPLCLHIDTDLFRSIDQKEYHRCYTCQCTFLDPKHRLSSLLEKAHYQNHQNSPEDEGYRSFLSKLSTPLLQQLPPNSAGLDYGCGPGPALAMMMEEAGHKMALYDPFFYPDKNVFTEKYDFVTCTETIEHFHTPAIEFQAFATLLKPGGILGLMTSFCVADEDFAGWHYRIDPTHVIFYHETTFFYLAKKYHWKIDIPYKDVVIFQNLQNCD